MFSSQKSQIVVQTLSPYAVAYAIVCLVLLGNPISELVTDWEKIFALAFFSVGLALLQDLIPRSFKEWLIFWRVKNRLPGHRAFDPSRRWSSVISRDEVVDIEIREELTQKYQDRLFYRIYDKYRESGSVKHYSLRYLQWRELASLAFISGLVGYAFLASVLGWLSIEAGKAVGVAVGVTLLCIAAARNASSALIDRVLLAEATEKARA